MKTIANTLNNHLSELLDDARKESVVSERDFHFQFPDQGTPHKNYMWLVDNDSGCIWDDDGNGEPINIEWYGFGAEFVVGLYNIQFVRKNIFAVYPLPFDKIEMKLNE